MNPFAVARLGVFMGGALCLFTACAADLDDEGADESDEEVTDAREDPVTTYCSSNQQKVFSLPKKTDLVVNAKACVEKSDSGKYVRGRVHVDWHPASSSVSGSGHKFDHFVVVAELLQFYNGYPDYPAWPTHSCDWTNAINSSWYGSTSCYTDWQSRGSHHWVGDGYVNYDIDLDGKSSFYWYLNRSPVL